MHFLLFYIFLFSSPSLFLPPSLSISFFLSPFISLSLSLSLTSEEGVRTIESIKHTLTHPLH